jgi:hypothetical protein
MQALQGGIQLGSHFFCLCKRLQPLHQLLGPDVTVLVAALAHDPHICQNSNGVRMNYSCINGNGMNMTALARRLHRS